jgi:rfaE bifunctional protein kinase chain/domain
MVRHANIFEAFNALNVLIVGDVMVDRYLSGAVDRISPEAPVPVVRLEKTDNRLGGAANVAMNIKALGATPYLASVIGADEYAAVLLDLLPANGLNSRGIAKSPSRLTTVKTRVMAGGQQLLRVDRENTEDLDKTAAAQLLAIVREILDNRAIHVIIFQDYNKGVLSYEVIRGVILEAIKRDIPTVVDPKYKNFWAYKHVTLFKPNLKEVRAQSPKEVRPTPDSLRKAAEHIHAKLGNHHTMITLSERGLYYHSQGRSEIVPTQPRLIADVCGAGDTVVSVAALGLALGLDMRQTAVLANLAGGQVCERLGVVHVDKQQLRMEYEQSLKAG